MAVKKKNPDEGVEEATVDLVRIRVTKFGGGKISTGEHRAGFGDVMAERGSELDVDRDTARAHEAAGLAEIVEG